MATSINLTAYARSIGYQGRKSVLVQDGIVVSHGNQLWSTFCDRLREQGACAEPLAQLSCTAA